MTTVYVLLQYIPYEGYDTIGVFSTEELAKEAQVKLDFHEELHVSILEIKIDHIYENGIDFD